MNVEIKMLARLRVGVVHHVGPYNAISKSFAKVGRAVAHSGIGAPVEMVALYYDDPRTTPAARLHSDAGIVLEPNAKLATGLAEQHVPGGRYATTVHVGSYEQLGNAWMRFMDEWLPASGHKMGAGFIYETYLNNPMTTPTAELRTELRIPLE